jgi:hypothetical protein
MSGSVLGEAVARARIVVRDPNELHSDAGSTLAKSLRDAAVHLQVRPGHVLATATSYGDDIDIVLIDSSSYPFVSSTVTRDRKTERKPAKAKHLFIALGREEEWGPALGRMIKVRFHSDPKAEEDLHPIFLTLVDQWRAGVAEISSFTQMVSHPAYLKIISLGPRVIPLLLQELEREPDHWFLALHVLTGADPVKPESRARVRDMAKDWINWGRAHGY